MQKTIVPSELDASIDTTPVTLRFHPLTTKQCGTMEEFVKETMSLVTSEVHFNGKTIVLSMIATGSTGDKSLMSLSGF